MGASLRHGVHGIENEISQSVANLAFGAHDGRQLGRQLGLQVDDQAPLLGHIAPAGACQIDGLLDQAVEIDGGQDQLRLARPIEFPHARDGFGDVLNGLLDGDQVIARSLAQARFALQERFGVQSLQ